MKKGSEMKVREEFFFTFLLPFSLLPEFSFSLESISREIRANRTPEGTGEEPKDAWFFFFSSFLVLELLASARARVYLSQKGSRQAEGERAKKRGKTRGHWLPRDAMRHSRVLQSWLSSTG